MGSQTSQMHTLEATQGGVSSQNRESSNHNPDPDPLDDTSDEDERLDVGGAADLRPAVSNTGSQSKEECSKKDTTEDVSVNGYCSQSPKQTSASPGSKTTPEKYERRDSGSSTSRSTSPSRCPDLNFASLTFNSPSVSTAPLNQVVSQNLPIGQGLPHPQLLPYLYPPTLYPHLFLPSTSSLTSGSSSHFYPLLAHSYSGLIDLGNRLRQHRFAPYSIPSLSGTSMLSSVSTTSLNDPISHTLSSSSRQPTSPASEASSSDGSTNDLKNIENMVNGLQRRQEQLNVETLTRLHDK
ncbi:optomotor-blind protein-like [Limulus polyphemus]|uniref:Optomotor-blind protein-like n=1 Tax=Limulus polyphemus TaxID=6850 RepID=A0ABM1RWS5_LIMPO|nr:optomotor-blind protein-like [Limulus polyphemus]